MSDPLLTNNVSPQHEDSSPITSPHSYNLNTLDSNQARISISMQLQVENESATPIDMKNEISSDSPLYSILSSTDSPIKQYLSNKNIQIAHNINEHPQISLSKLLFNIEHYILIPIMFSMAFFVYFDRGGLSSALSNMQTQLFEDSALKVGIVASGYLFGFCISSPMFAIVGSYHPPMKIASIGMVVWSLGTLLTGIFSNFYLLIGSRLLTGIGEASFLAFAGTIIDTIAPNDSRAMWLAIFYMGIPLGYAFGFGIGGFIADADIYHSNGYNQSWRGIFILEAIVVLPLCLFLYLIKSPSNMLKIKEARDILSGIHSNTISDDPIKVKIRRVLCNPTFLLISAGYATQTFMTGTFSVEAITYLEIVFHWSSAKSGIIFGAMTLSSGIAGSIFGGIVLDKLKSRMVNNVQLIGNIPPHKYIKITVKFLCVLSLITFPITFIAIFVNSVPIFIVGVLLAEFLIFAAQGPTNTAILWSVVFADRPLAATFNTLFIHLFGDACAPIVVGLLVDSFRDHGKSKAEAYNLAFLIAASWLVFSAVLWGMAVFTAKRLNQWFDDYNLNRIEIRKVT